MALCLRDRFLRALVLFGAALFISTECLGVLGQIRRTPLAVWWVAVLAAGLIVAASRRTKWRLQRPHFHADPVVLFCITGIAAILTLTAITAAFSPPNSADAMAYHMPRVIYWAEDSSVRFFPTPYFNQIMLQPFAEYLMLHTYVLSGGDRFIDFVQWFASCASIICVSSIARLLGADARGQAVAALFCATVPAGILASSGAKNDYFMAMWLAVAVYYALRLSRNWRLADAMSLGAALGFTLLTKATGYLFAPWILAAIVIGKAAVPGKRRVSWLLVAAATALAINTPQYIRNFELSGSVLGFDSAQGDGVFRWRNEAFGWKQTTSNVLRNLSDQLGARSDAWNQAVYSVVVGAHRRLGIDVNDPSTTFRESTYGPPVNANHEANAPNRWHLLMIAGFICLLFWHACRGQDIERALYALALVCGFVSFCAYLKWQAFFGRLLLPLFVLGSPLASLIIEIFRGIARPIVRVAIPIAVCLFLLNNARHAVLENWVRPLEGPLSVLHRPRDDQYFADMTQWNDQSSYVKTVNLLTRSKCSTIGIDITNYQLEYPLQALLRERNPEIHFVHTGVRNASNRFPQVTGGPACAVVGLDCAGDSKRLALYRDFRSSATIGKFVVFLPN